MHRIAAILLTGWVLVIAPALCLAGVLEHLCSQADCHRDCESSPRLPDHDCQDDPCDALVIQNRPAYRADELTPMAHPARQTSTDHMAPTAPDEMEAVPGVWRLFTYPPAYADRGLPLLV